MAFPLIVIQQAAALLTRSGAAAALKKYGPQVVKQARKYIRELRDTERGVSMKLGEKNKNLGDAININPGVPLSQVGKGRGVMQGSASPYITQRTSDAVRLADKGLGSPRRGVPMMATKAQREAAIKSGRKRVAGTGAVVAAVAMSKTQKDAKAKAKEKGQKTYTWRGKRYSVDG